MAKEFRRKKKPKVFQRRFRPRCWVCHRILNDLISLHEWEGSKNTDDYDTFKNRVTEKIIVVIDNGIKRYRHNREPCEPGGIYFMQNEELVKKFRKNHGIEPWRSNV